MLETDGADDHASKDRGDHAQAERADKALSD